MSSSSMLSNLPRGASEAPDPANTTDVEAQQPTQPSQSGLRILINILVYLVALPSLIIWAIGYLLR